MSVMVSAMRTMKNSPLADQVEIWSFLFWSNIFRWAEKCEIVEKAIAKKKGTVSLNQKRSPF